MTISITCYYIISLGGSHYLLNGLTEKFFTAPNGRGETYRELSEALMLRKVFTNQLVCIHRFVATEAIIIET